MLSSKQISEYRDRGYLILKNLLEKDEFVKIEKAIEDIEEMDGPEFYREKDSRKVRTIFAPEKFHDAIQELVDNEKIRGIIGQLINSEFYLFQSKLNSKASLQSGVWSWHQDFKFWREDGMLQPDALTLAIFLTDVDISNGPILAIPGSQKYGEVESFLNNPDGVHDENLKYLIKQETLAKMVDEFEPITPLLGKAGDAVIFSSNILHGSYQNMGIVDRKLLMFTFNPTHNIKEVENPRPEYMVKTDKRVLNLQS